MSYHLLKDSQEFMQSQQTITTRSAGNIYKQWVEILEISWYDCPAHLITFYTPTPNQLQFSSFLFFFLYQ